jgi:branched-chain amino acid transport system permease protein
MARSQPVRVPPVVLAAVVLVAAFLPLLDQPYFLQVMTNALLYAVLALSLTLVAGTVGLVSIGQAALFAIGAYASALLAKNFGVPLALSILFAGCITAAIATMLIYPAFRLRGLYVSIATLAIGEIVSLLILNWTWLTEGPMGVVAIPPLGMFGVDLFPVDRAYWLVLAVVTLLALMQGRFLASHLGRTWRAIREDDIAAQTYGVSINRYKALAFVVAGFIGGIGGAISAHLFTYINHETFNWQTSLIALTIVIAGGMGNVVGAILASVVIVRLPELFRVAADFRLLFYGLALLFLVRFRPQGILGTA